jgi:hypothetical protein
MSGRAACGGGACGACGASDATRHGYDANLSASSPLTWALARWTAKGRPSTPVGGSLASDRQTTGAARVRATGGRCSASTGRARTATAMAGGRASSMGGAIVGAPSRRSRCSIAGRTAT